MGSRAAMNIYFWLFLIIIANLTFYGSGRQYFYPQAWYYLFRGITITLLAGLLYANNLWLVPRYLISGKKGKYFLFIFLATYVAGLCYAGLFEQLDVHFPKISMDDISLVSALRVKIQTRLLIFLEAFSWLFSLSIFLFIFTVAWYMHDYKRQKQLTEAAQKKQVETELVFLKSQLNPHFLFNTLNNLYVLTIKKSDNAPDIVSKLSTILRYLLYESDISLVSFEREKEIMQAYIDLELLRLPNKSNMHFTVAADKPYTIPPLLWMPVLENVFKHGTRFISSDYFIDFHFEILDNRLSISSKNGFKAGNGENNSGNNSGIGLSNFGKRLALLYPGKHTTEIKEEGNYFVTNIQIQLV